MKVYCVWRLYLEDGSEGKDLVAICSTLEKANMHKDEPNFDIEVSIEEVDSDEINSIFVSKEGK